MTRFFWNDAAALGESVRDGTKFYLAGKYFYSITAAALDKNGDVATNRIFDPVNKTFGLKTYEYKNVAYPVAPENVLVDENGLLTWTYDTLKDIYSTDEDMFVVEIHTKKADGTANEVISLEPMAMPKEGVDISGYLVAGGAKQNEVYVYRESPTEYYQNSEKVLADMSQLPAQELMPEFGAEWSTKRELDITISQNDKLEQVVAELLANGATAEFEISLMRVDASIIGSLDENDTFDTINLNPAIDRDKLTIFTFRGNPAIDLTALEPKI